MTKLAQAGESCDTVFLDPPRAGTTEEFVEALGKLRPEKIVYVSCKIETLERDLKLLAKIGYKAQLIQPVPAYHRYRKCGAFKKKNDIAHTKQNT